MARTTLHRIFGLLALLAVGLASAGPASADTIEQGAYAAGSFNIAAPDSFISRDGVSEKSVCVHVTKRSHESCPACSTSFVITNVGRVRPKAPGPKQKADNNLFGDIQISRAAGRGAARLGAIYGLLAQAGTPGTNTFARTGRLRI